MVPTNTHNTNDTNGYRTMMSSGAAGTRPKVSPSPGLANENGYIANGHYHHHLYSGTSNGAPTTIPSTIAPPLTVASGPAPINGLTAPQTLLSSDLHESFASAGTNNGPATASTTTSLNSSISGSGGATSTSSGSVNGTVSPQAQQTHVRRKPIPRKGHTKSRMGCFNCKRRKVKCQENQPKCAQCLRLGLQCEYPIAQKAGILSVHSSATGSAPPLAVPNTLELEDLKFFYHFIVVAYPPLPLGCDEVWRKTAGISSSYDFLAHAILGLAASHLGLCNGEDYNGKALSHRVTAINLLNEKLSQPCKTQQDGDALFGAVMVLAFQAAYLPDAMIEFVTMVRGCDLVAQRMMPDFGSSRFNVMTRESHANSVQQLIKAQGGEGKKDQGALGGIRKSVMKLGGLCAMDNGFEGTYWRHLSGVIDTAGRSYAAAWVEFTTLYMLPSAMNNDEYSAFAQPNNWTAQLLLVHMFILDFMLGDHILHGSQRQSRALRKKVLITWIEKLGEKLPKGMGWEEYIAWPLTYGKEVIERGRSREMVPTKEYLDTLNTLGRTREKRATHTSAGTQTVTGTGNGNRNNSVGSYPSPEDGGLGGSPTMGGNDDGYGEGLGGGFSLWVPGEGGMGGVGQYR